MVRGLEQLGQVRAHPLAQRAPVRVERPAQLGLHPLHRERRVRGDPCGDTSSGAEQLVVSHDPPDESDAQRLGGVDHIAGEQQLGRPFAPDELGEPADAGHVADEAAEHEQLAETGPLARHPDVGEQRQLHAPADSGTVDGRHDRQVAVQQRVGRGRDPRPAVDVDRSRRSALLASAHHLADVVAAAEGGVRPGHHQAPCAGRRRLTDEALQLAVHLERQGVARLGTVEREQPDQVVAQFERQVAQRRAPMNIPFRAS